MAYYTVWFSKTSDNTDIAVRDVHYIIHGVANRTKPNQKPIEPNRSIGVRLVRQSNIIELELFCEFD